MDVALSCIALVGLAPVMAFVAISVRVKLGSPVIFAQERPGLGGRVFTLRKFRSMTEACGANGQLLPPESRLTPFGRALRATSLDELPELINVIRGDMSLVGPRPLRVEYLSRYTPMQSRRHLVRPGITGLAQVSGRSRLEWESRFECDVAYVDNASFAMDIRIMGRTIGDVLRRRAVEPTDSACAVPFGGGHE